MALSARVGVIGCGWWATRAHLPALAADPDATIAALADPDEGNRERAAERFGVPPERCFSDVAAMLDGVPLHAVVVAVPHAAHYAVATMALERGLHTLLEKPMTIEPADARALEALARDRGVELLIGYPWHYEPAAKAMRDALRADAIGRIEFISAHYAALGRELYRGVPERYRDALGFPLNTPGERTYADVSISGGGQAQAQTTHVAALICWLSGLRPVEVGAMTGSFELEVDLVNAVTIRFDGGAIGSLGTTGSLLPGQPEQMEVRLFGSNGNATLDLIAGTAAIRSPGGATTLFESPAAEPHGSEWGPVENLVDIVLGRGINASPASIGVMAVDIVDGLYRSAKSSRTVTTPG